MRGGVLGEGGGLGSRAAAVGSRRCRSQPLQRRKQLLFRPGEEALLGVADLDEGEMREAGLGEGPHCLAVALDVGTAGDGRLDVVRAHEAAGGREGLRPGQVGVDLPAAGEPTELVVSELDSTPAIAA